MKVAALSLLWGAQFVQAAINLDGSQAVKPAKKDDPSPISDPTTYIPDQHDCPLPCTDMSNIHSWIPYLSVERLQRCNQPMLLQFSVSQPLNDRNSNILIRSCTLGGSSAKLLAGSSIEKVENPKKSDDLFIQPLQAEPACRSKGHEVKDKLKYSISSGGTGDANTIANLLDGMTKFFEAKDNCDESFVFAYHKKTVASVYIGSSLGRETATSALKALSGTIRSSDSVTNHTVAQLCSSERKAEKVFGVSIDTTGNLAGVQKTALEWSKGNCANGGDLRPMGELKNAKVLEVTLASNGPMETNSTSIMSRLMKRTSLDKRATCRHIEVQGGDSCGKLAERCGISGNDFTKYNKDPNLCSSLQPGDNVCCSEGDPYVPPKPSKNPDGTCATHLISNGDNCDALAKKYNVKTADIETWNKGKTWAWTECKDMLVGYNMCVSDGDPPLPAPQEGVECGPMVPGTQRPSSGTKMSDLNPCPLKACCSNWGFCGVFPAHCDIHAPAGGGPGSKEKGFQNTCVSNCGNEIKQNSGPPSSFGRIGYFESFGLDRECLLLKAKNANTDGSYTHMHWGFGDIDSGSWSLKIKDDHKQWDDFKKLPNMKRIVSIGGWAYSTEAATYNIIRSAIIDNRETFATNLAKFVNDEGIDGIDIDWEYPGAPDILVGGSPIGKKGDGLAYLKFLTTLKQKLGPNKSVSIAAPASYWYLKAFPIDKISEAIDYIVYMTYDLHGQWDYGNANAYDMCPSGKCIRSHVNLTETRNSLSMLTKAGVKNNKIFVGEASYGRSFHMAQDGCWGPTCDFTGSRTQSDAAPGRCTKTGGYVAYAEINEIIKRGDGARTFHDDASNSDIMLYKGDYISYMTPTTKDTRRNDWKGLNFGGSIDWAVDLQEFTGDDMDSSPGRPQTGEGCVSGEDDSVNSGDLCEFSCAFGFCPESLCSCVSEGPLEPLPEEKSGIEVIAWDEFDVDLNRLCKFACKYGYCPDDVCTTLSIDGGEGEGDNGGPVTVDDPNNYYNYSAVRWENSQKCVIFKDPKYRDVSVNMCKPVCQAQLDEAADEGRTSNYGCLGFYPLDKPIPWERPAGAASASAPGKCICDNWLINEIADTVIEALPAIAQIGCYILMSSLKFVVELGAQFIPGVGKVLDGGLDMLATAAQIASYVYDDKNDPAGAFDFWLSPCGGSDLVPEELKKAFDILNQVSGTSFKTPKSIPKGSGRKGDQGNPKGPVKPRPGGGSRPPPTKKKCNIPASKKTQRLGAAKNTLRLQSCVADKTVKEELIITSLQYAANARATQVVKRCEGQWAQACYHYSSAIRQNPQWATLTCPGDAATTKHRLNARATSVWSSQHKGEGWLDPNNRQYKKCDRDEYPPAYLLGTNDPAYINSGVNSQGQLMRFLPDKQNQRAGQMWKGSCFNGPVRDLSDKDFRDEVAKAPKMKKQTIKQKGTEQTLAAITVGSRPEFTIGSWGQTPAVNDGLSDNPCWPRGIAAADPGMALLTYDPYYGGRAPPYDYKAKYVKGSNGS